MEAQSLHELSGYEILEGLERWTCVDLDGLLTHLEFDENWLCALLQRTRAVPAHVIGEIYRRPELRKRYRLRLALLRSPHTPFSISANLVESLRWVDLMQSLRSPRVPTPLKRRIEKHFEEHLEFLTLGEKIALARQSPRDLIKHLRLQGEPQVLKALFHNPFFTYDDALFLATYPKIRPQTLALLGRSRKWVQHKDVRYALLINPRTPQAIAQELLTHATPFELRKLAGDGRVRPPLKREIQRILND